MPPDSIESSFKTAEENLLKPLGISPLNVHRLKGELDEIAAADEFERILRCFFNLTNTDFPRFDLILLGMDADGHTASLFPGSGVLAETKNLVAATFVEKFGTHRLTLTPHVINNAANVVFLTRARIKQRLSAKSSKVILLPKFIRRNSFDRRTANYYFWRTKRQRNSSRRKQSRRKPGSSKHKKIIFQHFRYMRISLVISDVDATLITPEHEITTKTARAVRELKKRGIGFALASSRPPRGLYDFAAQLDLTEPFAAFNGGVIQRRDGETLVRHTLSRRICEQAFEITENFGIELWVYCDHDWHVDKVTPFVEREQNTIGFQARFENDLTDAFGTAAKLVIVGDPMLVAQAEPVALEKFGAEVSATKSKPRFLDITAKEAHKGTVVAQLSKVLGIPTTEIAVIGDGLNDVLMFEQAGFSIAMGQATDEVKQAANVVTNANTEEGFADAMEKFILSDFRLSKTLS